MQKKQDLLLLIGDWDWIWLYFCLLINLKPNIILFESHFSMFSEILARLRNFINLFSKLNGFSLFQKINAKGYSLQERKLFNWSGSINIILKPQLIMPSIKESEKLIQDFQLVLFWIQTVCTLHYRDCLCILLNKFLKLHWRLSQFEYIWNIGTKKSGFISL